MDRTPFGFSFFVYGGKPRWIDRINTFNASNVSFKQVIFPVLLNRTNIRACHHSRPICVSDVMSRYAFLYVLERVDYWESRPSTTRSSQDFSQNACSGTLSSL